VKLTYKEFKQSAESPILRHFNDHLVCGTWCIHRDKSQADLQKLKKYCCKEMNAKLFQQCQEISDRFTTKERLKECHHR
jgi:hypothetical protein